MPLDNSRWMDWLGGGGVLLFSGEYMEGMYKCYWGAHWPGSAWVHEGVQGVYGVQGGVRGAMIRQVEGCGMPVDCH